MDRQPAGLHGCSIGEFNNHAIECFGGGVPETCRGANFVLTGVDLADNVQYCVEPLRDVFRGDRNVTLVRDYDSVIGFTKFIPFAVPTFLYPLSNKAETLTSSVHVSIDWQTSLNAEPVSVAPHKVPNIAIGKGGLRTLLRMFFPGLLRGQERGVELTDAEKAAVYDDGLYPAIRAISPEAAQNWPTSYAACITRAKNRRGGTQFGTHPFPPELLPILGATIRRNLASRHEWAHHSLFMTQIQGVKEATQHDPGDAWNALSRALKEFVPTIRTDSGYWFVDVGMEISEEGRAYQWRTDGHAALVRHVTQQPQAWCAGKTNSTNRNYRNDKSAGLLHLSGFRLTITPPQGPCEVHYMQAYTTDKALTYHKEGSGYALRVECKQLLNSIPPYFDHLYQLYQDARHKHNCGARVEVRVPLAHAEDALWDMPERLMRQAVCTFDRKDWWQWRSLRTIAITRTLTMLCNGNNELRMRPASVTLTAALGWLVNGLHNRPEDGCHARDLMVNCLPLTNNYNSAGLMIEPAANRLNDDVELPICEFGAIFLRKIHWPPEASVPRFTYSRGMNDEAFIYFF
ncbi:hypothetical protein BV22DRAFT_1135598, partial [Leucogyrophana mollusca]